MGVGLAGHLLRELLHELLLELVDLLGRQPRPVLAVEDVQAHRDIPDVLHGLGPGLIAEVGEGGGVRDPPRLTGHRVDHRPATARDRVEARVAFHYEEDDGSDERVADEDGAYH